MSTIRSKNSFCNVLQKQPNPKPFFGRIRDIDERDGYYIALDLDDLVLEAFENGGQYKLPTFIREDMLEEQNEYLSQAVTFYRPDKSTEMKNIRWCLDQDFLEVEKGLWSGSWFFDSEEEWDVAVIENRRRQEKQRKIHIARLQERMKLFAKLKIDFEGDSSTNDEELETTSSDEDDIEDCNNDDKWETNSDEEGIEDYPYKCIDDFDDRGCNLLSGLDDLVSRLPSSVREQGLDLHELALMIPASVHEQMLQEQNKFILKLFAESEMNFGGDSSNNASIIEQMLQEQDECLLKLFAKSKLDSGVDSSNDDDEFITTSSDEDGIKTRNNNDKWETNSDEEGIENYPYYCNDEIDDGGYNTALDLDDLVLEAFKNGEQYKLPSSIREHMLQEQNEYLSQAVTFYRPDKSTEMKNIRWCLDQDFLEVEEGLWSGSWFFDSEEDWDFAVNQNCLRQSSERKVHIERLQKSAKDFVVNCSDFEEILKLKANGNLFFASKKYKEAIGQYNKALDLFPLSIGPVPTKQLDEHVNILSNKAESLLRLKKYQEAQTEATEALLLDSSHVKSLLRRAKATFRGAEYDWTGINPFALGMALEDLKVIMALGGEAAVEAEKFKIEIECSLTNDSRNSTHVHPQWEEKQRMKRTANSNDNFLASSMFELMCDTSSKANTVTPLSKRK